MFKQVVGGMLRVVQEVLRPLTLLKISENQFIGFFIYFSNNETNKFDELFTNIGLENVAVAAARVVELSPCCSNKEGKKRRCL